MLLPAVARCHHISSSLAGSQGSASPGIFVKRENPRTRRKNRLRNIPLPSPIRHTLHEERVCSTLLCSDVCPSSVLLSTSHASMIFLDPRKVLGGFCGVRLTSGRLEEVRGEPR